MKHTIIIWGHPYGTHTHSYVHYGFERAFRAMGHRVEWVDGKQAIDIPSGAIVFTENGVSGNIPMRKDLRYIVHNCDHKRFEGYKALHMKCLADFNMHWGPFEAISPWEEWNDQDKILLMPWATPLLPGEIDLDWSRLRRERVVHYVGTVVRDGTSANWREFEAFARAAAMKGLKVYVHGGYTPRTASENATYSPERVDEKNHRYLVQTSVMAPVIVGKYQNDNRYIPCRVFKAISYGHHPVTNGYGIYEFFGETILYEEDPAHMVKLAMVGTNPTTARALMLWVRDNHTYINRAQTLLRLVEEL